MTVTSMGARVLFAGLLGALLSCLPVRAAPDAQALLQASDAIRNPRESFKLSTELFEYRAGKLKNSLLLTVYARPDGDGRYGNLIRFEKPARDANKLMLFQGKDLWFYDPTARASFRLSPRQRLIGQAANGDVVNAAFARDYQAVVEAEEDVADGDRATRQSYKLRLTASTPDATYAAIEYWQDRATANPIKARFFTASGQLLKTAFYRKFEPWLGKERPTEVVIIDGLNAQWVTILRYAGFAAQEIPEAWMQRDYLPRFQN
ncbi:outer membrane lipoprotein-sorting protein [Tahibacter amnicola]|uniref:Outer membrane lipoprotein-sorting protein n=1 Tax=Tahibacter amnicola TaxID=2976241 RepID=A0ABY6B933_9GAMM|nr:outer membrane lipoprotein-sorting protein [Tahibacter amnicola]UXI66189.1 outer membrane lipoprotein-sorting protein [Tahibacter amnicola]